jgi:hypothetical protein
MPRKTKRATGIGRNLASSLCRALEKIAASKLRGRDADFVRTAIRIIDSAQIIDGDIETLKDELAEAESLRQRALASFPGETGEVDLLTCFIAVEAVRRFLVRMMIPGNNGIDLLKSGLAALLQGSSPPAMFLPQKRKGRRSDSPSIAGVKGVLAGLMHVQQSSGMDRNSAAAWIARNVSHTLAVRISGKPITPRMIEEWLDRYGGDFGEEGPGRTAFLVWMRGEPVSAEKLRDITENMARILPVRKPR